jgi:DtxR family Mn-dependent transcriptional regulator
MIQLSEANERTEYSVASLYERDPKLLVFLHKLGIGPQTSIRVVAKNYDETLAVETSLGEFTLGKPAADKVWVRPG